jgi:hypothetical protein
VEAPVLDQSQRKDTEFSQDVFIAPADKIKKNDISPKSEKAISDIPKKILTTIEILRGDTGYSNLFSELIDFFHKTINTEKENALLKNKLKELESRLEVLECQSENEIQ